MPKIVSDEVVFAAVVQVFGEQGYGGAATKDFARRAGINEVTLFLRYGGKLALIELALRHALEKSPLEQVAYSGDLRADLGAIYSAYQQTNEKYGAVVDNLLAELPRMPELQPAASVLFANIGNIMGIFEAHQAAGRLKTAPPMALINRFIGPLMARGIFERALGAQPRAEISVEDYVEGFLEGCGI